MMKTIEQATVQELDALAAANSTPEYPAEGLKAQKYEAIANQLGEGYEFESEELPAEAPPAETVTVGVAAETSDGETINAVQFGIGDEQIEITAGETVELDAREAQRQAAGLWFLEVSE